MLQRLSNAVPLCKVVARPSFCSERPSNRSNQTQYHLVEKWTIPRQRHVFKRSLTYSFTSIKLLFLSFTSLSSHVKCLLCQDSSYLPSLAFGSNGVQQRTFIQEKHYSTWDIRELTARDFAGLSMPSPSHFVIILHNHHVFLVHLLISASWLRSENHNCPTAGISEQSCLSQCLCSNILRQFKQSNYSSLPHDVEWRNIFSVMEQSSWMKMHLSKTVNMYSIII